METLPHDTFEAMLPRRRDELLRAVDEHLGDDQAAIAERQVVEDRPARLVRQIAG